MTATTTRYRDMRPLGARPVLRSAALTSLGLAYQLTGRMSRGLAMNRIHILYFHHVFPDEEPAFRKLLQTLAKTHQFISYTEAAQRAALGEIEAPYVAFSFDDGLKSCRRAGEILHELGIGACFFLCPSLLGVRDRALVQESSREALLTPRMDFLDWADVEYLLTLGHEVGAHTMRHANLGHAGHAELEAEVDLCFETLKSRLGEVRHFAWPFGTFHDFTLDAARRVFSAGFSSCASALRGCHAAPRAPESKTRRICLRREHLVADWPLSHALYFLAASSMKRRVVDMGWPTGWEVVDTAKQS